MFNKNNPHTKPQSHEEMNEKETSIKYFKSFFCSMIFPFVASWLCVKISQYPFHAGEGALELKIK